ncbi:MAG: hypothetical protein U9R34_03125 [Nanoarchaeota archaeon]|nr:hypothetical protein [Nanoarchaeota archaeon]
MGYLNSLKDISRTQVLAKGMNLKDILKDDFLKELEERLGENYSDIVAADIRLMLLPKQKEAPLEEDEKGIIIHLAGVDFIRFEQPSPGHYKDKIVKITSNRADNIDKIIK